MGGTNKQHKHKSKKKKHHHHRYRDSDSEPEKEYTKSKHHKKSSHKDKKVLPILVDAYGSTDSSNSDDDVIIVSPPPAPKISKYTNSNSNVPQVPPAPKISSSHHSAPVSPPPPPTMSRSHVSVEYSLSSSELSSEADEDEYDEGKSNNSVKRIIDGSSARPSNDVSLSVEETNRIRAKLGLKPLETTKVSSEEKQQISSHGGIDMGDFVHKPPENIAEKQSSEKLKERLALRRDKRIIEERLLKVKKLADESDSDDDVRKWVEKNRRIVSEKEMAEKRAKELAEMDELFGIGELVEEDMKITKKQIYGAKDLKGLKVEHSLDNFSEGHDVILTLQDKPILGDDDDTLVNVNMLDEERYKKNIEIKRKKPGYNAYDDDEFDPDYLGPPEKKVLRKYDEEIEGEKKASFVLGNINNISLSEEARRELIRTRLQQKTGRKLESLQLPILQPATDYYTEEEIAFKFKKPKKKIRKIRKPKPLTADDLLSMENNTDKRVQTTNGIDSKTDIKPSAIKPEPPSDPIMDVDDVPAPVVSDIKIEEEEEDDSELQVALKRARKLKQIEMVHSKPAVEQVAVTVKIERSEEEEEEESAMLGNTIVLNETAEFCRTLGDIPTYGHSGNRDDVQQILDFETELKDKKKSDDKSGWNEVELDKTPVDIASYEKAILDEEPDLDIGVAGALKLAASKGYLEKEKQHRPSASKFSHLQAQNYSIEDKAFIEDDKHSRRERFNGPTQDFKEKDGYKPNIKLEYIDDDGHLLSSKEAFRYLSHKFHGKGPGKNKIEKRMKKSEQESLMKQMSSTDTPLGTLNMLQQKQKETQSPYVILSGAKQGQSTSISKLKF